MRGRRRKLCWSPSACIARGWELSPEDEVPAWWCSLCVVSHGGANHCGLRRRERCRGLGFGMALNSWDGLSLEHWSVPCALVQMEWEPLRVVAISPGLEVGMVGCAGDAPLSPGSLSYYDEEGLESMPIRYLIAEFLLLKGGSITTLSCPRSPLLFSPTTGLLKPLKYMYMAVYRTSFVLPLTLLAPFPLCPPAIGRTYNSWRTQWGIEFRNGTAGIGQISVTGS